MVSSKTGVGNYFSPGAKGEAENIVVGQASSLKSTLIVFYK